MNDYLIKVIAKEEGVLGFACVTTDLGNDGARRHQTSPTAGAVLSRALTSAALMGARLKIKQRIALKFSVNGPIKKMVAESNSYGKVRGYVAVPDVELPRHFGEPDIASAVGTDGLLTVVKDLGMSELHEGIVAVVDGSIVQDMLHYLERSEQVQSVLDIDALISDTGESAELGSNAAGWHDGQISSAGGILIQALPNQNPKILAKLSQRLEEMPSIAYQIRYGQRPEDVMAELFRGIEYETLEKRPLSFACSCSWQRTEKALLMLGKDELTSLLAEGEAVVDCHFCGEQYVFGQEALETIIDKL